MAKPVLLSGIQPTGRLHLGNYLGALKNFVDLQNLDRYQCYFFVADLHSLTENFNPKDKKKQIQNLIADYVAVGLSPKKSTIFIQSHIPAHSELAWVFNTISYFGELKRMTQFKDKSKQQKDNMNIGLFTYPLLMAADILLYDPRYVPVGEDQIQHLELTRELARRFNKRYGKIFTEPQPILTESARIMSLRNPHQKMSKSQPEGCIFIDDSPTVIRKKIMSAVTDSGTHIKYDKKRKAGISNLLEIYSALSGKSIKILEKDFANKNYVEFKKSLAQLIIKYFSDYRRKKSRLMRNPKQLERLASAGARTANKVALKKMALVYSKLNLLQ